MMRMVQEDRGSVPQSGPTSKLYSAYESALASIVADSGSMLAFSEGHKWFGLHATEAGVHYRELAPNADCLYLFGDFNKWQRFEWTADRDKDGVWTVFIPSERGRPAISHNSKLRVGMRLKSGTQIDRVPAWITYTVQNPETFLYDGVFWNPPVPYNWQFSSPEVSESLKIYECHVGISSEKHVVNSYNDFTDNVLPKITGYNALQLMGVVEHVFYGSFGLHVTNLFAVSSRYGTPDHFKRLVDTAHRRGFLVLIDVHHSHMSSNALDGLNLFDGTDSLYFRSGSDGVHEGSRIFDYKSLSTLRLLLSNLRWLLEEYKLDGFRFNGVASMLHKHHKYTQDHYNDRTLDVEACVYLMLANELVHTINPRALTIVEDSNGMPGMCVPVQRGGFGFDYRMNMGISHHWSAMIKEKRDEEWILGTLMHTLITRPWGERAIGYCENYMHSMDKSLAMQLCGPEIHCNMSKIQGASIAIQRGISLHKMVRLMTHALAGDAYLNFMGSEFGHPDWVEFPSDSNGWSYERARRLWHLKEDHNLYFHDLWNFDCAMNQTEKLYRWLGPCEQYITLTEERDKIVVFEKARLLFVFNFHPTRDFESYRVGTQWKGRYEMVLNTDDYQFGGKGRISKIAAIKANDCRWQGRPYCVDLYLPSRTAVVLKPCTVEEKAQVETKAETPSKLEGTVKETPVSLVDDSSEIIQKVAIEPVKKEIEEELPQEIQNNETKKDEIPKLREDVEEKEETVSVLPETIEDAEQEEENNSELPEEVEDVEEKEESILELPKEIKIVEEKQGNILELPKEVEDAEEKNENVVDLTEKINDVEEKKDYELPAEIDDTLKEDEIEYEETYELPKEQKDNIADRNLSGTNNGNLTDSNATDIIIGKEEEEKFITEMQNEDMKNFIKEEPKEKNQTNKDTSSKKLDIKADIRRELLEINLRLKEESKLQNGHDSADTEEIKEEINIVQDEKASPVQLKSNSSAEMIKPIQQKESPNKNKKRKNKRRR